jgi:glucokinase
MILAGDIGGTHTRMALLSEDGGRLSVESEQTYSSREHASLGEIITDFIGKKRVSPEAACFGVAGPVLNGRAHISNLAWIVDALQISQISAISSVSLINDLLAHAYGIGDLHDEDLIVLNAGTPSDGNAALIAAGTGLGEAGMFWDGSIHHPFPGEGGHADFAPNNDLEVSLFSYLLKKFGHVSYERVLSGPGLKNIYDFLRDSGTEPEPAWLKEELDHAPDQSALISQHGLAAKAPISEHALDIFVSIYGAEAGNLALRMMAVGGIFISGGIAGKILPKLQQSLFIKSFVSKGRMISLLDSVPVRVIINEHIGLLGAARYALTPEEKASQTRS